MFTLAQDAEPDPFAQFLMRFDGLLADVTSRVKQAVKEVSPAIIVDYRTFDGMIREGLLRCGPVWRDVVPGVAAH